MIYDSQESESGNLEQNELEKVTRRDNYFQYEV